MDENEALAQRFEENRSHLRAVAYRMLGSLSDADDAVQEAWLRLSRSDTGGVENLGGWLTTVVARVCLDMLRARKARREETLGVHVPETVAHRESGGDPEQEAMLADAVGLALLVVLDSLDPAERLAFVLHDMFAVTFDEIAPIVGRSPVATRQLASRARRRVQGTDRVPNADRTRQREVVDAYLAAARAGDFDALLAVLAPDVVLRADQVVDPSGAAREIRDAAAIARSAMKGGARLARAALVNGAVGIVIAPRGRLVMVLDLTIQEGKIVEISVITNPARLQQLDLAVLDAP
ncbi:MAG TPA: sigma-70 family RNA polymerase sigma factor [Chthonomonadaceae bacterium]|nr:sigma-70 family RNA polymerase sigma factor [Chthonomonadaceae bacterium]